MTAIASLITVFTIPVIINLSLLYFLQQNQDVQLPIVATMISLMKLTIIPISLGMLLKKYAAKFSLSIQKYVSMFGMVFLAALIIFLTYLQQDIVIPSLIATGPVALLLNISTKR